MSELLDKLRSDARALSEEERGILARYILESFSSTDCNEGSLWLDEIARRLRENSHRD